MAHEHDFELPYKMVFFHVLFIYNNNSLLLLLNMMACWKKKSVHYCLLLCICCRCFVTCAESMYFKLGLLFMKDVSILRL